MKKIRHYLIQTNKQKNWNPFKNQHKITICNLVFLLWCPRYPYYHTDHQFSDIFFYFFHLFEIGSHVAWAMPPPPALCVAILLQKGIVSKKGQRYFFTVENNYVSPKLQSKQWKKMLEKNLMKVKQNCYYLLLIGVETIEDEKPSRQLE